MTSTTEREKEDEAVANSLATVGMRVSSVWDLVREKTDYPQAIPILLQALRETKSLTVRQGIVRALATKSARGKAEPLLIDEFLKLDMSQPRVSSLKWAIGNTLGILASDQFADQLIALACEPAHGTSRQMIVMELGKLKTASAANALESLLTDEDVSGHAAIALGRAGSQNSIPMLQKLANNARHKWVRKAAELSIKRISAKKK